MQAIKTAPFEVRVSPEIDVIGPSAIDPTAAWRLTGIQRAQAAHQAASPLSAAPHGTSSPSCCATNEGAQVTMRTHAGLEIVTTSPIRLAGTQAQVLGPGAGVEDRHAGVFAAEVPQAFAALAIAILCDRALEDVRHSEI